MTEAKLKKLVKERLLAVLQAAGIGDQLRIKLVFKTPLEDGATMSVLPCAGPSKTHFLIRVDTALSAKLTPAELDESLGHEVMHALLWPYADRAIGALREHLSEGAFNQAQRELIELEEAFVYRTQGMWRQMLGHEDPIIEEVKED